MRTLDDLDVAGKRVLVRVDFNVPLDEDGHITDDTRIRAALPTLRELRAKRRRALVLLAHLGRPEGPPSQKFSLRPPPCAWRELLGADVALARDLDQTCRRRGGDAARTSASSGETKNDPELAKRYAALADVYVNDAFGAAHRAHASTEGVAHLLPSAAGRLLEREVTTLTGILEDPQRPLVAVVGGAKVTDKIGVLEAFLERADTVLIGGAMCFPFFKAQGHAVGASLCEEEDVEPALEGRWASEKLELPIDLVVGREFNADTEVQELDGVDVPDGWMGLDVGPRTADALRRDDRRGRHGVLERPDGRVRARAVRGGHEGRRRGGGRQRRDDRRRRRRLGRGAGRSSGSPTASRTSRPAAARRSS